MLLDQLRGLDCTWERAVVDGREGDVLQPPAEERGLLAASVGQAAAVRQSFGVSYDVQVSRSLIAWHALVDAGGAG
ncbi:hypothetical protein GCM10028799_06130 [Kribbella italica]